MLLKLDQLNSHNCSLKAKLITNPLSNVLLFPFQDGSLDFKSALRLRIEFAQSLCIADEYGILDSIGNIATMLYLGIDISFAGRKEKSKKTEGEKQIEKSVEHPFLVSRDCTDVLVDKLSSVGAFDDSIEPVSPGLEKPAVVINRITSPTPDDSSSDEVGVATPTGFHDDSSTVESATSLRNYSFACKRGFIYYGMISGKFILGDPLNT